MTDALDDAAARTDPTTASAAARTDKLTADAAPAPAPVKADPPTVAVPVTAAAGKAADTAKAASAKPADKAAGAVAPAKSPSDTPPPPRSMDEIEADLAATRERLAERIDEITDYVKPANVIERQKRKLRSVFVDEYGGIKPDRVLMAAGIVVAIVGIGVLRRRRHRD